MSDDLIAGIPVDDVLGDADFDPNAVESDVFLDDPKEVIGTDLPDDLLDDDELLDDE